MKIKHKKTNQILPIKYEKWVENIVSKGNTREFEIIEFPDIVQVLFIQPSGETVHFKIMDRKDAMEIIRKYPRQYDYAEINVYNQVMWDIERNKIIKARIAKIKQKSKIKFKNLWIFIKKFHKGVVWVAGGLLLFLGLIVAYFQASDYLQRVRKPKDTNLKQEVLIKNDSIISKTDSLTKK